MAESGADKHTEYGDCGVGVAFAGENKLTQGAAAQHYTAKTNNEHTEEVPKTVGVGDCLTGKAGLKAADYNIADKGGHDKSDKAAQQSPIAEEIYIANAAHHAEAGALAENTNGETCDEGGDNGGSHAAGAFGAENENGGNGNEEHKHNNAYSAEAHTFNGSLLEGSAEGEALIQEKYTCQNADGKTGKTNDCIKVAACNSETHTQGAAKEHQSANHNTEAQHKADNGSGAATGLELLLCQRNDECAEGNADNLRSDILHNGGGVELHSACGIADEASNAKAHVCGVAKQGEHNGNNAHEDTGNDKKEFVFVEYVFH